MSIAEARHEHAVARLDHLGVGTDVLAHPRLVTHIDEDAILNRYCLSRKLCAIGREHLPLKYGIRLHRKLLSCDPLLSPKRISLERLRSERRFILCAKRSISLNLSCTNRLFWQAKRPISFFGAITPRPVRARRTTAHGSHRTRFGALIPLGFTLRLSVVDSRIGPWRPSAAPDAQTASPRLPPRGRLRPIKHIVGKKVGGRLHAAISPSNIMQCHRQPARQNPDRALP